MYTFDHFEEDAHSVLANLNGHWTVPAEALCEAIAHEGWTLRERDLPSGQFCSCDAWHSTITLSTDLDCSKVRYWILATQLGQIRLNAHLILGGQSGAAVVHQTTEYAMAFLLPYSMVSQHPLIISASRPLEEAQLAQLSDHFRVPAECVQATLEFYRLPNGQR